ncbi:MAG: hypothetical protein OXH68_00490 [Gammaproteobacteria bacterium]|nr:hypothetical protein [Gammaproteobacteria bacterium]
MGLEVIAPAATQLGAVVALGIFLWSVFSKRFDAVDVRLDRVEGRLGDVENRVGSLENRVGSLENRFGSLEGRVGSLEGRFDSLENRFDSLDRKVDALAVDHHGLSRELSEFRGEMRGRLDALFPPGSVAT